MIAEKAPLRVRTDTSLFSRRIGAGRSERQSLFPKQERHEFEFEGQVIGTFRRGLRRLKSEGTIETGDVG
jgi:hypothetical protein